MGRLRYHVYPVMGNRSEVNTTVQTRVTRARLKQILSSLPERAASNSLDAQALLTRIGLVILGRIKQAFIVKARGGTDDAGERWASLSPKTIAYSRRGRTRTEKKRSARPSQALTAKQQKRWWSVYSRALAMFKGDKSHAASYAWIVLKSEGARTLFDKYSGRQVEILRDTGLLLNSLSPEVASSERIFRIEKGVVIVGTNRKGAAAHHKGVPGKLPQRRLWPPTSKWPRKWWQDVTDQVKQWILETAIRVIRGAS